MMLWVLLAVPLLVTLAWLGGPLLRATKSGSDRAAYDAAVYLDQLEELQRDRARGLIDDRQAEAARTEIERRLLAAGRAQDTAARTGRAHPGMAAAVVLLVAGLSGFLYFHLGSPGLPNLPFAERERATPPTNTFAVAARARIADAERQANENPDDPQHWFDLGRFRLVAGDAQGAAEALRLAMETSGGRADIASAYGEALTRLGDGLVTPEARRAFERARAGNPDDARARYFLALADFQNGREREALEAWSELARAAPANAPWLSTVQGRIAETARALGEDPADWLGRTAVANAPVMRAPSAPAPDAPRGPGAEDIEAARQMSEEDRMEMIRGMVAGLAARLEDEPGDVEGWRRLARSREVLGESEAAAEAYGRALALEPDHPETLLRGAIAAGQSGDNETALARFIRVRDMVPPDSEIHAMVVEAIARIEEAGR